MKSLSDAFVPLVRKIKFDSVGFSQTINSCELEVDLYQFFISAPVETDIETIEKLNKLLKTANKVKIGLIYNIVSSILELK